MWCIESTNPSFGHRSLTVQQYPVKHGRFRRHFVHVHGIDEADLKHLAEAKRGNLSLQEIKQHTGRYLSLLYRDLWR